MADMFGAPIGIGAAETDMRQQVQGALLAQKTLGEIALQPAQQQLTEAHAKLFGAEAEQKAIANRNAESMATLELRFQEAERQHVVEGKAARGQVATFADIGLNGQLPKNDPTLRLQRFLEFAERGGVPETQLLPLRKQLAEITEKGAIASYRNAQAAEQQQKVIKDKAELKGRMAVAALADPSQYQRILAEAIANPDPEISQAAAKLPPTWSPGTARILEAVRLQSIDTAKQAELALTKARDASTASLQRASEERAKASSKVADERARLIGTQADLLEKYGGTNTEAAIAAKKSSTAARNLATKAKEKVLYPDAPIDVKARKVDQTYTLPDQSRWTWKMNPTTGKMDWWRPDEVTPAGVKKAAQASIMGPAGEED
jgi:hypothetical protein